MADPSQSLAVYSDGPAEILLATDFCEPARRALVCARKIARARGAPVRALHVLDLIGTTAAERGSYTAARDSAEHRLREIRRELRLAGVRESAMLIAAGRPARAIRESMEQHRSGMLVVGLNGSRSRRISTMGATTRALLTQPHPPCPVLVVGAAASEPALDRDRFTCEPVLFVTDTDAASLRAALKAWPLPQSARELGGVPVWAVLSPSGNHDTLTEIPELFAPVQRVPLAEAALNLLREARERKAGLIVLSVRAGGYLDSFRSGSLGHALVKGAPCPVLTVRS